MSTGAVILTLSALTISHTVVLFDRVVNNARITTRNKIPLVICCISHLISRFQLMYLFDADAPRNCKAMVLVGNLCGLIVFRFTLLYLLSVLCLSLTRGLAKNDLAVKALNVVGWILFIASSVILMYQEIVTPFFTETCLQDLAKSLSSANNACFLCSFFCFAAPIIVQLFLHIKRSQGSSSKNGAIRKIYLRQLVFMVSFTVVYLVLIIVTWWLNELYAIMYVFILGDYVWLLGIYMWILPQRSEISDRTTAGNLESQSKAHQSMVSPSNTTGVRFTKSAVAADEDVL